MKAYRIVHQNSSFEIPEGELLLGRSAGCHLVLDDASVSRVHAAIYRRGDRISVIDRGSRNGIKVNGVRAEDEVELKDGDIVGIGHQRIRLVVLQESMGEVGMTRCRTCRAWMSQEDEACPSCGSTPDDTMVCEVAEKPGTNVGFATGHGKQSASSSMVESQPFVLMCGIATKTLRIGQIEESTRLMENMLRIVQGKVESGKGLSEDDFGAIAPALIVFAEVTRKPEYLSHLFSVHRLQRRLLEREQVERLYDLVRVVGYRYCGELTRYLEMLEEISESFTPGERFLFRRLQGLVKICS
jgi:hypothetical protein